MAYSGIYALDLGLDSEDQIWVVGQDLRMFDGSQWSYYNYTNSAVPSAYPYYLDTRTISISPDNKKWVGCGMSSLLSDPAVFYIDGEDPTKGKSWSFNDIDTFDMPMEVSKIYACPFGNDVLAFLNPLNTSDVTGSGTYSTVTYWNEIGTGLSGASAKFISFFDDLEGYFGGPYDSLEDAIYYTNDGGLNWERSNNGGGSSNFIAAGAVGFSSNGVVVFWSGSLAGKKYLVSPNNWSVAVVALPSSASTPVDVAFCFSDNIVLVLYEDGSIDRSSDGGVTFSALAGISTGSNFTSIGGAFNDFKVFAAGASGPFPGAIFLSTNLSVGSVFNPTPVYTGPAPIYDVHINPANVNRVYAVGATGTIIRSTLAGAAGTWVSATSIPTTEDLKSIRFSPSDQNIGWVVGASGTVLKTVDSGITWAFDVVLNPLDYDLNYLDIQSSTSGFGAGNNNQIITFKSYEGPSGENQSLYRYDIPNDEWKEVAEGYNWPFVYDIIARGFGGDSYRYYLGTDQGVIEIPGEELDVQTLENGTQYVPAANFFNSSNFSNLGDNVYSLDLDENFNLWSGTDGGKIQFWDFEKWNVFQTPGATASVTSLKTRRNGHVFWGDYQLANGIYHFNGATASLTSLPGGNEVLSIGLQKRNRNQDGILTYEDDLWILTNNDLQRLSYELPYIKASSKYEGATGWNFTYYTQATGASRPYPTGVAHSDRYSWDYPSWLTYNPDYTQYKFPGLDPRNMFLTAPLSDIASGEAGKQDYWNSSPVPDYSDLELEDKVQEAKWAQILTGLPTFGTNLTDFAIHGTAIVKSENSSRYMICGEIEGRFDPFLAESLSGVNLGKDLDGNDFYAIPSNPSLFASDAVQGGETYDASDSPAAQTNAKTGFIATYDEEGRVVGFMKFPGKSTSVLRISPSEDGRSVYAIGRFNGFIEIGDFIWSSVTNTPGPTGAPIGLTNSDVEGLATDFDWIYENGATAENSSNYGITWTYRSTANTSDANFRLYELDASTQLPAGVIDGDSPVSYVAIGQTPASGSFTYGDMYTGQTLQIGSIYYRIDSIKILFPDVASRFTSDIFLLGVTYISGTQSFSNGTGYTFNFYNWNEITFPLLRSNATSLGLENGQGLFIAELSNNIGNTSSLKDSSAHPEMPYQVKNFRHFPSLTSGVGLTGDFEQICADSSLDHLALIFDYDYFPVATGQKVSTLANQWRRTTDYLGAPQTIDNSTSTSDVTGILVLNNSDLSLRYVSNFNYSTIQPIQAPRISTISGTDSFFVSGSSVSTLNIEGLTLSAPASYTLGIPFYILCDFRNTSSVGITGSYVTDFGTTVSSPLLLPQGFNSGFLAKSDGYYVWGNQFYGGSGGGNYLGKRIESDLPYQYIVTGFISSANSVEKVVYGPLYDVKSIGSAQASSVEEYESNSLVTDKNHLVGFITGATSATNAAGSQIPYLFKQNLNDGRIELLSWGGVRGTRSTYSASPDGDIFSCALNNIVGTTGPSWMDNLTDSLSANTAVFLSKQYNAPTGVNMGQIISRSGSNPWTWCDVHQTDRGMEVPLMCTVFFSNYNSAIYGKQNNKWILSNSKTGTEILNVKNTPYFIYTFTDAGYYTIYNQVEDAYGNVYEISKSGFITVVDHKIKKANDENPLVVNSSDYGYPIPPKTKQEKISSLEKEMLQDQALKLKENSAPFTSPLIIKDNPDATFNQ